MNEKLQTEEGKAQLQQEYDYTQNRYGYYENVYSNLTSDLADDPSSFPGENPEKPENLEAVLTVNSLQEENQFTEGEEEFSSDGSTSTVDSDQAEPGAADLGNDSLDGADSFGSGVAEEPDVNVDAASSGDEFSDSTFSAGDFAVENQTDQTGDASVSEEPEINPDGMDVNTDNSDAADSGQSDDTTDSEDSKKVTTLKKTSEDASVGTSADPYVYLGTTIDSYPYYSYTAITDLKAAKEEAQKNAEEMKKAEDENRTYIPEDQAITVEDGQYYYWQQSGNDMIKSPITIITGKQPVDYATLLLHSVDETLPYAYYYRVSAIYFCCKMQDNNADELDLDNFRYYGWYYPTYPQDEDAYIPVTDNMKATHYISDAEYKLTPGTGDYDFIPGDGDGTKVYHVEIDRMYYTGGYQNHDWFKKDVFHLKADTEEFKKFDIEVDTLTAQKFAENYAGGNTEEESTDQGENEDAQVEAFTSEVSPMISEAGVELVSIEKEISEFSDQAEEGSQELQNTQASSAAENTDFQDGTENTEVSFSDGSDGSTEFSAGDNAEETVSSLAEYDLIYINGSLSEEAASVITSYNENAKKSEIIPCIINASKAAPESDLAKAFAKFYKEDDTDSHYVTQYVYFFRNTFQGQKDDNSLLNTVFNTNFNSDAGEGLFTDGTDDVFGFEEILKYIQSENRLRQLGTSTGNDLTDGSQLSPTPTAQELLSTKLSQARAIEYIINYRLKRTLVEKNEIRVLEIQPAKSSGQISDDDILKWMGDDAETTKIIKVESCCGQSTIRNILNSDKSKVWTSDDNTHQHWVKLTFSKSIEVEGFTYTPIQSGKNGILYMSNVELYDKDGTLLKTDGDNHYRDDWNNPDRNAKSVLLREPVTDVKSMKIIFKGTYGDDVGDKYASAAHIGVLEKLNSQIQIEKKVMTASEFVGHIDDINSEYDIIYIGDDGTERDIWTNGDSSSMLYTHTGGTTNASGGYWKLIGQMTDDFNADGSVNTNSYTASFKGSGNDITAQQYRELMDFTKSGYPVIISDGLLSGENIDTEKVDNSSYWYQYLKEALSYNNVMSQSESKEQREDTAFYLNIPKPEISFSENGMPYEAPRGNKAQNTEIRDGDTVISKYDYITGQLEYKFTIKNDAAVSTVNTQYDCKLYLDLNFDGNLSDAEEQSAYIEIRDADNVVQTRTEGEDGKLSYHLTAGKEYRLVRKIPSDYYKLIAWKLEILDASNSSIRTSVTGYSKQKNTTGTKIPIHVLQIVPEQTCSDYSYGRQNGTWDLTDGDQTDFQKKISSLEDFNIIVEKVTVGDFGKSKDIAEKYLYGGQITENNKTKEEVEKQIVIIGFDDVYENISTAGVEVILDFIEKGKSVIFSHDTTSHYNYLYDADHNWVDDNLWTPWILGKGKQNWGVSMNQILREVVGMDRYGITSTLKIGETSTSVSDLLKKGRDLKDKESVDFATLMELAGDVAYKTNSDRTESYAQTQGYSNSQIKWVDGSSMVYRATKVNDGAITQYPYVMKDEIHIAGTHAQYYQLALEQDRDINGESDNKNDIVVWYCLSGGDYSKSPNDVRNNYYFYSKGNVIYTGAGHSAVSDSDEIELFINAIVAAANVAAVKPEVSFVKKLNPAAETEAVRYYMTDQSGWTEEENNLLQDDVDLYFNVRDYNMVSTSLSETEKNQKEMTAEIYIEDENSGAIFTPEENEMIPDSIRGKKIRCLNTQIGQLIPYGKENEPVFLSTDQKFYLDNNAYKFNLDSLRQFLQNSDGSYKSNCKVYVRIKSKVSLYGREVMNYSWSSIDLKQRQLFDLD